MRLRRHKDIKSSIDAATRASEEARERLARTQELLATQKERARAERVTIIAALKRMREANNLARMILDTVEQQAGQNETGSGAH